jgi:hypothetical protein
MFLNEYDVAEALVTFAEHPILGPATRTLSALVIATNANSDGWAYWPKPSRAARKLQELIVRDGTYQYRSGDRPDVTVAEYRKALAPLKAFRTRSGLSFEIFEVTA